MDVLMITSEASPFAQTGGLGEVLSALPGELVELGINVDVLMPKYRGIDARKYDLRKTELTVQVILNARKVSAQLWTLTNDRNVRYLFLDCDPYFDREYLYGTPEGDYEDNAERFVFLTRAAFEIALAWRKPYDVFHAHDWQAALAPVYLRTLYAGEELFRRSASVMTIHNLGYQGIFWHFDMPLVGVGWEFFTPKHMEFHGKLNFLKSGIVFADEVNTVSPGYKNEILTPEFGFGLEGVLQEKGSHLTGIINGVDYRIWNPENDTLIAARYGPDDLSGKAKCKIDLQAISGLAARPDVPVLGLVSRLSNQKGVDILINAIPSLLEQDIQLVILGTGDSRHELVLKDFARDYSGKMAVFISYDNILAHKIFAGSDMLLVPSRYEPCGLTQLYALKYGSVPIVRMTGGLIDTVDEFDLETNSGTGFRFKKPEAGALIETVKKAISIYREKPFAWKSVMIRGMNRDFSWKRSAIEYLRLYEKAINQHRSSLPSESTL